MTLLYHHLGLGDHIVCNGMVRQYHEIVTSRGGRLGLAVKPNNEKSVRSMYSDLDMDFIVGQDSDFGHADIKIGFGSLNLGSDTPTEIQFYQLAGMGHSLKYTKSKFCWQDKDSQQYDVFIHDDPSRGLNIPCDNPNTFRVSRQYESIMDYVPIMLRAKEIRVIESSFMHLIECMPEFGDNDLYVHKVRSYLNAERPVLKKAWNYV